MNAKTALLTTGVLLTTLMAASPAAFADRYGKHERDGTWNKQEMCENARQGKGPFNHEARKAEREQYRADMADRLKLTKEQRETWNQIHKERQEQQTERMAKWQKNMQERCEKGSGKDKE